MTYNGQYNKYTTYTYIYAAAALQRDADRGEGG